MADKPYSPRNSQGGYGSSAYPGPQGGSPQNPTGGGGAQQGQAGGAPMPYAPQGQQVMPQMFTGAGGAPQGGQMPQGYMPQMGAHGGSAPPPSAFQGVQGAPYLNPLTEQSYIENILRLNLEKVATVYATFEGNTEWNAKVFRGEVEAAGRDHVIINDTSTGTRYLIPMVYVDYITFQGPINYAYPFQ